MFGTVGRDYAASRPWLRDYPVLLARHYFNVPLQTQDHSYGSERRDDATVVRGRVVRGSLRMRDGPGGGG